MSISHSYELKENYTDDGFLNLLFSSENDPLFTRFSPLASLKEYSRIDRAKEERLRRSIAAQAQSAEKTKNSVSYEQVVNTEEYL